mmetsp:Transcript_36373/g.113323  ORF Transcript_36373/g.113323 Transcript_36373/m.113323 type:complete len:252 (-) Transcript_36373:375-1130(-)
MVKRPLGKQACKHPCSSSPRICPCATAARPAQYMRRRHRRQRPCYEERPQHAGAVYRAVAPPCTSTAHLRVQCLGSVSSTASACKHARKTASKQERTQAGRHAHACAGACAHARACTHARTHVCTPRSDPRVCHDLGNRLPIAPHEVHDRPDLATDKPGETAHVNLGHGHLEGSQGKRASRCQHLERRPHTPRDGAGFAAHGAVRGERVRHAHDGDLDGHFHLGLVIQRVADLDAHTAPVVRVALLENALP